ncbi:hypothetical protein [Sulfurimonas sp. HSL-1716]|uniref:hypothetical protein n=1 Tax=Hydrocurvibacter sulfurireducens TaxID=3131937 RepID=UPI0031F78CB6
MKIHYYSDTFLLNIDTLSVALTSDCALTQSHAGILYIDSEENPNLLHLEGYNKLTNESPSDKFIWLNVPLSKSNKKLLALYCEDIFEKNKKGIPYDIELEETSFDEDLAFIKKDKFGGLTCSTLIMQIFKRHAIEIINRGTWPIREEDKSKQLLFVSRCTQKIPLLLQKEYTQQKMLAIAKGISRYRPEEVVCAASMLKYPHPFSTIDKPSKFLLKNVEEYRKKHKECQ